MNEGIAIKVEQVSKVFSLRQATTDEQGNVKTEHWALKDVSFEIKKGDSVGIIGPNGSGKSTLLKILAGITKPTSGSVSIRGRVASILDIGAGFHPELSGRENVFLSGQIHGFSKKEITSHFDEIVAFSGIGAFIDEPVKNYSNGMYLRLAFSIMAHLDFDVYLFDEVMSVGDADFNLKSSQKIQELSRNKTMVFVSHNTKDLLNRNVYLQIKDGKLVEIARDSGLLTKYLENSITATSKKEIYNRNITINDFSSYKLFDGITIQEIAIKQELTNEFQYDLPLDISIDFSLKSVNHPIDITFLITDILGNIILTLTPLTAGYNSLYKDGFYSMVCQIPACTLGLQTFSLSALIIPNINSVIPDGDKRQIEVSELSKIQYALIRLDNIIHFKTQFKINNQEISLKNLDLASGILPVYKWQIKQSALHEKAI